MSQIGSFNHGTVYVIIPVGDITQGIVNCYRTCCNNDGSYRTSNDGTLGLIKFDLNRQGVEAMFMSYLWYNHDEIVVELAKAEWTSEI